MERASPSTVEVSAPTAAPTATIPTLTETAASIDTPVPCDPMVTYCIYSYLFPLKRPIALPGTISFDAGYPYGSTEGGTREPHHGVEFENASGTPVLAAADGVVAVAGDDSQVVYGLSPHTYGNLVVLEHHLPGFDVPIYSLYGHLSQVEVSVGQQVRQGDEIGRVGMTGIAIGSHLHFEVREGADNYDSNRNPALWLKPLDGPDGAPLGVLAGRLVDEQGHQLDSGELNIQYFPDSNGQQAGAWQLETYAPEEHPVHGEDMWGENFAKGDLMPGNYRLSFMWGGKLYEKWVKVGSGELTVVVFKVGD